MASTVSPASRSILFALTTALLMATVLGVIGLWPSAADRPERAQLLAPGVELLDVEVTEVPESVDPLAAIVVESVGALFLAGVIVSGFGALNDVTITQASSVWELRAAMPEASRLRVFASAMRIGRDHIASTVYTLAYAYIGSALPVLLFASTIERSLLGTLTAGEIAAEVFRTLVASIGLVLAIPLTTGIAAALAAPSTAPPVPPSATSHAHH